MIKRQEGVWYPQPRRAWIMTPEPQAFACAMLRIALAVPCRRVFARAKERGSADVIFVLIVKQKTRANPCNARLDNVE